MKNKGFTLIELLVVVAIIGVLATIVLSSLSMARANARDTKRLAEVRSIQKALELYHLDNGEYPQGYKDAPGPDTSNCSDQPLELARWNNFMSDLSPYLPTIPPARPWPLCLYYLTGSFPSDCDAIANPGYTILFGTEEATFVNLDTYNTRAQGGLKARYCIYAPQ